MEKIIKLPQEDSALLTVLEQLIKDLADPAIQYVVSANYYEHQTPARFGERWYIAQIWLWFESAWNVVFSEEGLLCDVKLNRHDPNQVNRILLRYDQIWNISKLINSDSHFTANDVVYYRSDKLNLRRPSDTND